MKRLHLDEPVDQFAIPKAAQPKAVAEAEANFRRVASELADVKSRQAQALQQRQHEIGQAHAAAANARVEGKKPPAETADKVEARWDLELDRLSAERAALLTALDTTGDLMIEAIRAEKRAWLKALTELDESASERLAKLLDEVRAAVHDVLAARGCRWWIADFNADHALSTHGSQTQFPGATSGFGSGAIDELEKLIKPEQRLVALRDDDGDGVAEPQFEDVIIRG